LLFRTVPREHWLIQQEHDVGTPKFTIKKLGPALYRSTLRSVLSLDKIVFTHGFIKIALSTALLISITSRLYSKTTGVNVNSFRSGRKRVNHTAINSIDLSLTDYLDCITSFHGETSS